MTFIVQREQLFEVLQSKIMCKIKLAKRHKVTLGEKCQLISFCRFLIQSWVLKRPGIRRFSKALFATTLSYYFYICRLTYILFIWYNL